MKKERLPPNARHAVETAVELFRMWFEYTGVVISEVWDLEEKVHGRINMGEASLGYPAKLEELIGNELHRHRLNYYGPSHRLLVERLRQEFSPEHLEYINNCFVGFSEFNNA